MLSDEIRTALFARQDLKAKSYDGGAKVKFRCPRHQDKTPSAWTAGGAWGCFACGFEESITTLASELGIGSRSDDYTLADYADEKGFSVERLESWSLSESIEGGRTVPRVGPESRS